MVHFWRKKSVEAVASVTTAIKRSLFGIDPPPVLTRAQFVHQTMMAIRQHAIRMMPRVDGELPAGAAMDSLLDDAGDGFLAGGFGGTAMPDALAMWYMQQSSFVGHQMCAMIATHWLVNKACSQMPRDAIRKGYKIISDDGNELDPRDAKFIERYDEAFGLKKQLVEFVRKGRIFGIRIALFRVDSPDPYYYEKPFNIHGVLPKSYKGIVQIDPYWCAPLLDKQAASNPLSQHFYEPTYWLINGKKIHRSHFVIYINDEVMDFLKPSYIYGGVPLPQQIMERVYAAERTANEGPMLAMSKRTTIMKTDTAQALANKEKFDATMQWWMSTRDNYQVRVIGEDDEITQLDTALADLDKVIMNQYQLVCGQARTPAPKLLGTVPTGFNATGDYEEASYHEECESVQDNDFRPLLARHHALVIQSYLRKPIRVRAEFNPMDAPTEAERADTNLKKAQMFKALFDMGAVDEVDINEAVRVDPTMGLTGITPAIRPAGEEDVDDKGEPVRTIENSPAPSEMFGASASGGFGNDPADSSTSRED